MFASSTVVAETDTMEMLVGPFPFIQPTEEDIALAYKLHIEECTMGVVWYEENQKPWNSCHEYAQYVTGYGEK